jgi:hypothetical protein
MALLRDDPDSLFALVGAAADHLGLLQSWVEKDFWITELLRSVAKETDDVYAVFKGGTSLSKALRLTQRFSQDVDILIVVTTQSKEFGKGSLDARLKLITSRAAEDLALEAHTVGAPTRGVKRYSKFEYPTRVPQDEISREVLLEMGTRGSDIPESEWMSVSTYIADYLQQADPEALEEFEDLAPVPVRVLAPERTLTEKLSVLNTVGARYPEGADNLVRAVRHLYDIDALLRSHDVAGKLKADPSLIERLTSEVELVSREEFDLWGPRPDGGFAAAAIFDPTTASSKALRAAYEGDLPALVYGDLPTFDDCLATIKEHAGLL